MAVTVLEVIQRSTEFLANKRVESPRLQAELLLAHVLKWPRMQLYLNFERVLTSGEEDVLRQLVKRRGQREPLQHIIGSTCFCGFEIVVNGHVLVPRPETELLAEQGWLYLNSVSNETGSRALDFGTGSGCIAIALALKCPSAYVIALDRSDEALRTAQQNAAQHHVTDRMEFVESQGFDKLSENEVFDLIVANPPYIPTSEIDQLEPEVRDHDPRIALDGGPDGLDCYRHLATRAGTRVKPGGKIMLEFGDGQQDQIANLFQNENWVVERILTDYTQRPRILIARRTH